MANSRFPRVGDKVRFLDQNLIQKYGDKVCTVKKSAFVFNRDIVIYINGINRKIPVRNVQIVEE